MIILISTDMTVVVVNLDFCTFLSFCLTFLLSYFLTFSLCPHFYYYLHSLSLFIYLALTIFLSLSSFCFSYSLIFLFFFSYHLECFSQVSRGTMDRACDQLFPRKQIPNKWYYGHLQFFLN